MMVTNGYHVFISLQSEVFENVRRPLYFMIGQIFFLASGYKELESRVFNVLLGKWHNWPLLRLHEGCRKKLNSAEERLSESCRDRAESMMFIKCTE